jgi:squamous cell carcinoma antigen recognized by T-cells 3
MEVTLARLDAIRRRGAGAMPQLRETFTAASQTLQVSHIAWMCTSCSVSQQQSVMCGWVLQETFGDVPDPLLRLPAYWADCEAHLAADAAAARAVWEAVLKTAAGRWAQHQACDMGM